MVNIKTYTQNSYPHLMDKDDICGEYIQYITHDRIIINLKDGEMLFYQSGIWEGDLYCQSGILIYSWYSN